MVFNQMNAKHCLAIVAFLIAGNLYYSFKTEFRAVQQTEIIKSHSENRAKVEELAKQLQDAEKRIEQIRTQDKRKFEELNVKLDDAKKQQDSYAQTHSQDEVKIEELRKQLEDAKEKQTQNEQVHTLDEKKIEELTAKLDDAKKQQDSNAQTHSQDHEAKIEKLNKDLEEAKKRLEDVQKNQDVVEEKEDVELKASVFAQDELCSYFPSQPFTATRLWHKYLPKILEASKNPLIPELLTDKEDAKMRTILEETLSASRLRKGSVHLPTFSHDIVKNVVEIIQKRIQDPKNNPPLRVAVFGGSVTIGRGCYGSGMGNHNCAWAKRFELLINQFASLDIVQVYNLGIGGTTTIVGTNIVKYWMYPQDLVKIGPDVIVNSYSTNDSLEFNKTDTESWIRVMDRVRHSLQEFIRVALQSKQCGVPPLVVHVDDYVGPQVDPVLTEISYNLQMTQLARWYDTLAISYGEVVRDITYQDKAESTFSNKKDVHYGHWAHQTIAWTVGFASLELLRNYCDDEYNLRISQTKDVLSGNSTTVAFEASSSDNQDSLKQMMKKNKLFLPPPLTKQLTMTNIPDEFESALNEAHASYIENDCGSVNGTEGNDMSPCIVSWISSPGGYRPGDITRFINRYKLSVEGWTTEKDMGEGWGNKIGYVATKPNATFSLKFDNIEKDVKAVTIYSIKSYGEKWQDSRANFTISAYGGNSTTTQGESTIIGAKEIPGIWDDENSKYSLTMSEKINLSRTVLKGETIEMKADLVGGGHFKIMGIMICNI